MKAIDFMNNLQKDSTYIEMQKQKEQQLLQKLAEIKTIETPFINDLQMNGFIEITNSNDLFNLKKINSKLTNLLLTWLPKIDDTHNSKQMLVRALIKSEQPFDGKPLIELFDDDRSSETLKWTLANTIASTKVLGVEAWLENKLNSNQQGKQNEMLVYAAAKYFDYEKAEIILKKLFDIYPLQVADVLSNIGNAGDLSFLQLKSKNYKGSILKQMDKYINKMKKLLSSKRAIASSKY